MEIYEGIKSKVPGESAARLHLRFWNPIKLHGYKTTTRLYTLSAGFGTLSNYMGTKQTEIKPELEDGFGTLLNYMGTKPYGEFYDIKESILLKNGLISKVKRVFLNQPYLALYPISDKTDIEKAELVRTFNTCDLSEESETATLLSTLYKYTLAKVETAKLNKDSIERNLANSYKTKKHKTKDKETGEKKVEKITTERKGNKKIIERFQTLQERNEQDSEKYEELVQAFEQSKLTVEHLPLIDSLLLEHKYKKWIYKVLLIAIIAVPILLYVLPKIIKF